MGAQGRVSLGYGPVAGGRGNGAQEEAQLKSNKQEGNLASLTTTSPCQTLPNAQRIHKDRVSVFLGSALLFQLLLLALPSVVRIFCTSGNATSRDQPPGAKVGEIALVSGLLHSSPGQGTRVPGTSMSITSTQ